MRLRRRWILACAFGVHFTACDEPRDSPVSGVSEDASTADVADGGVAMPVAPAPPVFDDCPAPAPSRSCLPWPEAMDEPCSTGAIRLPGADGCVQIGTDCSADGWPTNLSADHRVLYVRTGATGTGSLAAPFGQVADALRVARAGDIVALSVGDYSETVVLPSGISLVGACASNTRIASPTWDAFSGAVTITGNGGRIQNLQIGGARAGVWADGASVALEDVWIRESTHLGIAATYGARVTGHHVVVEGTQRRADGRFGYGLVAGEAAEVTLVGSAFIENHGAGVSAADDGTTLALDTSVVAGTESHAGGRFGEGLVVAQGGHAALHRVVLAGNRSCGISVQDTGTALSGDYVWVRGTRPREADGELGCGVDVRAASANISRLIVAENASHSVAVHAGGVLTVGDAQLDGGGGVGLGIIGEGAATVQVGRVQVANVRDTGVLARGRGTTLELTDAAFSTIESDIDSGERGRGLEISFGATASGARVAIQQARDAGLFVGEVGASARFEDITIDDTRERTCAASVCPGFGAGVGAVAVRGGTLTLAGFAIRRAALAGAQVAAADLDLARGLVAQNPIGVAIQSEGFDFSRVTAAVAYVDNGRNVERTELPIPTTAAP